MLVYCKCTKVALLYLYCACVSMHSAMHGINQPKVESVLHTFFVHVHASCLCCACVYPDKKSDMQHAFNFWVNCMVLFPEQECAEVHVIV